MRQYSIWEHFEHTGTNNSDFNLTNQIIGNFNSAEEFWQIMNQIPHIDLKNIFFNDESKKLPVYDIDGDKCRVNAIGVFLDGILPEWEDDANKNGGELQLRFFDFADLDLLQDVWYEIIHKFIQGDLCKHKEMVGIRIVDKSDGSGMYFRIEFWFSNTNCIPQFKKYAYQQIQVKLFNQGVKSGSKIIHHTLN